MSDKKQVIGLLEQVWFPEFEKGKEVLEFQPLNKKLPIIQTKRFKRVIVRSSNGTLEERHRIETVIKVKDKIYPIKLSLTDRTDMKYDVIIGWQFLDDKFLVDVSRSNI
jgi:hypothetical protein